MSLLRGRILKGGHAEYEVIARLGGGAYGETYLARIRKILPSCPKRTSAVLRRSKQVVVKIPPSLDKNSYTLAQQRRFLARVYEGLMSESSVFPRLATTRAAAHVYDLAVHWVHIGGTRVASLFIVYEFIDGLRLDEWVKGAIRRAGGVVSAGEFLRLASALAKALGDIHRRGVVHGDIWPQNIILRANKQPVFIDFGQSIIRREMPPATRGDESHPYLAPERRHWEEADIFSLCAVLFYIATGQDPPRRLPRDIDALKKLVVKRLRRHNATLYRGNWGVADIIARGLRRVDNRRTTDAERLLEDIELFDTGTVPPENEAQKHLSRIHHVLRVLVKQHPLFSRMLARRVRQLRDYAEQMRDGMYDVRGDHNENVMMVAEFLSAFAAGDQYLTVTIPQLWFRDNLGLMGRFLSMSREIVARRITVRRIFLVTRTELKDPIVVEILRAHARMMRDIGKRPRPEQLNTTERNLSRGGIFTGIHVVCAREREWALSDGAHTGIWIRGGRVKVAYPYYDERTKRLVAIKLRPGEKNAHSVREEFVARLEEVEELRSFLMRRRIRF